MFSFNSELLTSCDSQSSEEVVDHCPNGGLQLQRHEESLDTSGDGNADDEGDVEPVDMLVPVLASHLGIGNVHLLGVSRPRACSIRLGRHDGYVEGWKFNPGGPKGFLYLGPLGTNVGEPGH